MSTGGGEDCGCCYYNNNMNMNKWYMHNTESVLENEMHKVLGILRYKQIT